MRIKVLFNTERLHSQSSPDGHLYEKAKIKKKDLDTFIKAKKERLIMMIMRDI